MTEFTGHIQPDTEIGFGDFVKIKMSFGEDFIHKVVGPLQSNVWIEAPIRWGAEPVLHDHMEDVLNVIQCGIDETKVIRVAKKDVEKVVYQ